MLRRHRLNDVVYVLFNGFIVIVGTAALLGLATPIFQLVLPTGAGMHVQKQPLWLQAMEVILLADLGFYFVHRAFHAYPALWHFHAVHHSIEEMDWLAAYRVHPVDQILTSSASLLPIHLLDFSGAAIATYGLLYHFSGAAHPLQYTVRNRPARADFGVPAFPSLAPHE